MLKVMLVDDEEWALGELREVLKDCAEIVGSFDDAAAAVDMVCELAPDVVFLDVSMPYMDGFEAAERIRELRPETSLVFVTAHSHFAIKAFEVEAVDYVLKPFEGQRVLGALARIERLVGKRQDKAVNALPDMMGTSQKRIGLWRNGVLELIGLDSIDVCYIKKSQRQVTVLAGGREYQDNRVLADFIEQLEGRLLRCHRSYYVRPAAIRAVRTESDRIMMLELDGYEQWVPVSRLYRQEVLKAVNG